MKIKKILCFFSVMILIGTIFTTSISGQSRKHDISVSYGILTLDQVSDILEDILIITVTFGLFGKGNLDFSGAPFLSYHYFPKGKRFGFGIAAGTYTTTGDLLDSGDVEGSFKENNYIFAGELVYRWISKKSFQLYSGGGIGVRVRQGTYMGITETDSETSTFPTFNVQLLGFRIGKKIGFFGEFGVGYRGSFVLGLDAQF